MEVGGVTADGEHDDDTPRRRLRFRDRLCFQACPVPSRVAFRGAGPRDYPLGDMLRFRQSDARNARRSAVEARKRPGVVGRTRAAGMRWPSVP